MNGFIDNNLAFSPFQRPLLKIPDFGSDRIGSVERPMAALQLPGSAAASLDGLRLAPSIARVSSPAALGFGARRLRSPQLSRPNLQVYMGLNGSNTSVPGYESNTALKYSEDQGEKLIDEQLKSQPSHSTLEPSNGEEQVDMHVDKDNVPQKKRYAKIHDFCLGIPFGGFVLGGSLFGFLFSRNPASLSGVLYGGAIMALGVFSLKVWRTGRSSLPFVLGQAALAATLFWKHFQLYSLTKKAFPAVLYVFISAAMICFYTYVLISGGNPPPKKLAAAAPS